MGHVLDIWQSNATENRATPILPDGCRDLICRTRPGLAPEWFISPLQTGIQISRIRKGEQLVGFRLSPGTFIDGSDLLRAIGKQDPDQENTQSLLLENTRQCNDITAILAHLERATGNAGMAARSLGIQPRQLHRILTKATGQGPAFWLRLARARRTARAIFSNSSHADIALEHGYADQSHMVRDMVQWFGHSPTTMPQEGSFIGQLTSGGFA